MNLREWLLVCHIEENIEAAAFVQYPGCTCGLDDFIRGYAL